MAASEINFDAYSDALLVLGTAGIVVPVVRRLGVSPVLGYLVAGAVLGHVGLGSFRLEWPVLRWFTITDADNVAVIAELGVVFLMFLIGLELSLERLTTMRRLVFGLGGLQVVLSAASLYAVLIYAGVAAAAALVLGLCLALSSTAVVLEVMSANRRLSTVSGRAGFAVLLAQDLAVVPLFLLIGALGAGGSGSVLGGLATALAHASVALFAIVVAGRLLLRPLYRLVAGPEKSELFIAATLFVVVGAGVAAALAGLSMALGAFVAGLMLAETEYRKAIETIVEPFKALLLGIFFFTIGMKIDVRELLSHPLLVAGAVAGLVALKSLIVFALMRAFRVPRMPALEASLMLGPGGEFAFVGIGLAAAVGLVQASMASFALAVTAISMALIPLLYLVARHVSGLAREKQPVEQPVLPESEVGHSIIVGHGRVGRTVAEMLEVHKLPFLAIDGDAANASAERRRGRPVYYGNAMEPGYLERCGLATAKALVLTIHDRRAIDEIVARVRQTHPSLTIVARARDAEHARHLYALGVTDAVPETIEASLQLSEAVLVGLGQPAGPVIASIHEKRDEVRHALQDAAARAGQQQSRGLRTRSKGP